MMQKAILGLVVLVAMAACVEFQHTSLPVEKPLSQVDSSRIEPSEPILSYNDGLLDDFTRMSPKWSISHPSKINTSNKDGILKMKLSDVGPNYEELTYNMKPHDWTNAKNIVIRARIDGYVAPKLRVDLVDKQGRQTNARLSVAKVAPREGFLNYEFRFEDHFKQGWPFKDIVDSTQITKVRINFNGGEKAYTGTLYIDEVRVVEKL